MAEKEKTPDKWIDRAMTLYYCYHCGWQTSEIYEQGKAKKGEGLKTEITGTLAKVCPGCGCFVGVVYSTGRVLWV